MGRAVGGRSPFILGAIESVSRATPTKEVLGGPVWKTAGNGVYFVDWGPEDGPILARHNPPVMGFRSDPSIAEPAGISFPAGSWPKLDHAALYALVAAGGELPHVEPVALFKLV